MTRNDPHASQPSQPAITRRAGMWLASWSRSPRGEMIVIGLALITLTLTAIQPFTYGSLPRTDDALQHLQRLIALDYSIRHGDFWPRYLPTLLYGYGEPLFNYYSPLSLFPFELLHLIGLRFQSALLIGLGMFVFAGAAGAYCLGKSWGGVVAGIGAACGYTYAPYLIYNVLQRGAVGEVAALALLPWVLWAFRRLSLSGRRFDFTLAVTLTGLMLLTHNITALETGALLAVYGLFLWWTGPHPPRFLIQMALAGVLAVGVTAFFWLPALAETSYIQLDRTRVGVQNPPDAPEFNDQFQTLDQTFGPPQPADLTWFNPPVQRALSDPQIVLAVLGLGLLAFRPKAADRETRTLTGLSILLLALIALMVFMTTQASGWVWATVPLIRFFQFPWRTLGPASLLLALAAGIGLAAVAERIPTRPGRGGWVAAGVIVMMVYALPWLYRLYIPDPAAASIVDSQNYERQSGQLGGTARGEFVPIWSQELPDPLRLAPLYAQDEVISRLEPNPAITVTHVAWQPTSASLTLSAPAEARLVFDWLYFPGWWATLDGHALAITPTPKHGLIGLSVPPGDHTLALGFGPTPLRLGASIASGVCAVLAVLLIAAVYQLWPAPGHAPSVKPDWRKLLTATVPALLAGVAIFGLKMALIDHIQSPIKRARFANGLEAGLQHPLQLTFGGQVTLLGYDLPSSSVVSGETAHPVLYWQPANGVIPDDYSSGLFLSDSAGNTVAMSDEFYPGGWATSNWVPGFYVRQPLDLRLLPGTPPGHYTLSIALTTSRQGRFLDAITPDGSPLGVQPILTNLEVTRPPRPPSLDELGVGQAMALPLMNNQIIPELTLVSATPPTKATVGDGLGMETVWRAETKPSQAYRYSLVWLNQNGQVVATATPTALTPGYPADEWQPGDIWRGLGLFYVPGRLTAGSYTVAVQLFDAAGKPTGDPATIGEQEVTTPPRTYLPPRRSVTSDILWDNGISLIGYDLPQPTVLRGDILPLTLYWLPRSEINTNLTLFVHLVDSDGKIAGQVDTIPAHATRPTTGWASGEFITDAIELPVKSDAPAGRYSLRIGWYDPVTGQRVAVGGGDFWLMPGIVRVMSGQ